MEALEEVAPPATPTAGTALPHHRFARFRRVVGEFLVIVVGVLTALAADGWRQGRADLRLESEYLDRLASDLTADTAQWYLTERQAQSKIDALNDVRADLSSSSLDEGSLRKLATDIALGSRASYVGGMYAQRVTFDELVSTGRLRLIRDPQPRADLAAYYQLIEINRDRLRSRETSYGPLSYESLPRTNDDEFAVVDMPLAELRALRGSAEEMLSGPAIAELNRDALMLRVAQVHQAEATELLDRVAAVR